MTCSAGHHLLRKFKVSTKNVYYGVHMHSGTITNGHPDMAVLQVCKVELNCNGLF